MDLADFDEMMEDWFLVIVEGSYRDELALVDQTADERLLEDLAAAGCLDWGV